MQTSRLLVMAVTINALLVMAFIFTNLSLWNVIDRSSLIGVGPYAWNPLSITFVHKAEIVGAPPLATGGLFSFFNFPFWLFFISTALNLYLIIRLQKSKETKPT